MTEAQQLFDKAAGACCPEQLTSPVLHRVLAYVPIQEHIWGGKGVGSQVSNCRLLAGSGVAQHICGFRLQSPDWSPNVMFTIERSVCCDDRTGRRHGAAAVSQRRQPGRSLRHPHAAAGHALHAADPAGKQHSAAGR